MMPQPGVSAQARRMARSCCLNSSGRLRETRMARIHQNYRTIVGFNLMLIILGVAGLIPPTTSALLHNASTLGISLHSMTSLLPEEEKNN